MRRGTALLDHKAGGKRPVCFGFNDVTACAGKNAANIHPARGGVARQKNSLTRNEAGCSKSKCGRLPFATVYMRCASSWVIGQALVTKFGPARTRANPRPHRYSGNGFAAMISSRVIAATPVLQSDRRASTSFVRPT